tara:strand:+ start:18 stop:590 length:573 start_codon:yes stop_codon:yes gene_type:complete
MIMRLVLFILFFNFINAKPIEYFVKIFNSGKYVKMEIDFSHKQYESDYNSNGVFFFIDKKRYVFDSSEFLLIVDDSISTTINHKTQQIIFSIIPNGQLNIFDILSGEYESIIFTKEEINNNSQNFYFKVRDFNYSGFVIVDLLSKNIRKINLELDINQSISVDIKSIELIENYEVPKVSNYKYEIIDLRG